MSVRVVIFAVTFILWLALTWTFNIYSLIVGALAALFVSFTISNMFVRKIPVRLMSVLWFLYYIPIFVWECIKANLDVAYRVIHPLTPLKPGIVKVKVDLKSELGLTFLANSITLTPGTMSVDVDKENGYFYIHWINVKSEEIDEASRIIVSKFQAILGRIFE